MAVKSPAAQDSRFPFAVVNAVGEHRERHGHSRATGDEADRPADHNYGQGMILVNAEPDDKLAGHHAQQAERPDVAL